MAEASMKNIPKTQHVLVLRTDFSDDSAWKSVCAAIQEPVQEVRANVDCLSDPEYDGLTVEQLTASLAPLLSVERKPFEYQEYFMFIVDRIAITHPDHPILVVDLCDEVGRTFRVIPSEVCAVWGNLWLANLDFADFADHADTDGIYRGSPGG
jgi:hypothetical protein